ncbi:Glycosyltransferase involved in cell wall bisynthesis [Humidesulfovibrio mexicanus]|uniref:Glycosyltransferase involved in cell wall bisynthesis n=1 Tax=Humidesulfovibrio mexicanus TaxID=147047 RepID=A0A239C4E2_9BACT|nr:glycosyltransferase [Humidesulfovibrio mexicanus]SNS14511.1 Glycosyltransferase involved in cell wall bisynthesis [Humidesulfovibrio mexicanus]
MTETAADRQRFCIDLHVHSRHSTRPSQWVLQRMGCPESFTAPRTIYDTARALGMGLVTITDHNTIAGALEIAHLPGAFVSEEITTYFPEDRCKLHVLAYDITEAQHADIQRVRGDVFELVPYLRAQGIVHVLAHPLFAVNGKLTAEHFEQALLLFNVLELNGSRDEGQNRALRRIVGGLGREDVERLACKHGIAPFGDTPWEKALVAGSDDHSSLGIARMHTSFPGPATVNTLLRGLAAGEGLVQGEAATPWNMAHNLCGIAYQFYKSRAGRLPESHLCLRYANALLDPRARRPRGFGHRLRALADRARLAAFSLAADKNSTSAMLLAEAGRVIRADAAMLDAARGRNASAKPEDSWRRFVSRVADRMLARFAGRTLAAVQRADIFGLLHEVAQAGSLYAMLSPFLISCGLFASERAFARQCLEAFGHAPARHKPGGLKMAHFTDTFAEVNGVARTIQQQIALAEKHGKDMTVVTCGAGLEADDLGPGAARFAPIGSFQLPEYPEIALHYPPFLKLLAWCAEQDFDCILTATPGPMGLAGLAIARILKIPVHGTYHTAFPEYVRMFTEDPAMEDTAWRYMRWFYGSMDTIYAPSRSTAQDLAQRGIGAERIVVHPRGVDAERFRPDRQGAFFRDLGLERQFKLLYVGRVSREKSLDVLAEAFRLVHAHRPDARLVVVGDGPYLEEMRAATADLPVVFTGYLSGEALAQAYAGSDLFVFPSATDTFGNVVLEAQASGLPVVVTSAGGPREAMQPGRTGLVVEPGDPAALAMSVLDLMLDRQRLADMAVLARKHAAQTSFDQAFLRTWDIYASTVRGEADTTPTFQPGPPSGPRPGPVRPDAGGPAGQQARAA